MNEIPRGIGDNLPPVSLIEDLQIRYKAMLDQFAELMDAAAQAPDKIIDDITHAKVIELVKKMRVLEKQADATREIEREPFSQKVTEVNGFFKTRIDPLKKQREILNERHEAYTKAKADAEKRRLEEEAERRRAEAARALAIAQEAERKKREAEEAQRRAEEETRRAEEARQRAIAEQKAAEERAAKAKLEEQRLARERIERQAAEAKQKAIDDAQRAERDAQRQRDIEAAAAAKAIREAEELAAFKAHAQAAEAKRQRQDAEDAARKARADGKVAERDEKAAMTHALREEARADKLETKADGPAADLGRSRSEHGAVGTLSSGWIWKVIDRDKLDMAALWPFIHPDAIETALGKWMYLQPPDKRLMAGAVMEKETRGAVR